MYDARNSSGLDNGNLVFGLVAVVVVAAAFAAAWFGAGVLNGDPARSGGATLAAAPAELDPGLAAALGSPDENRYVAAMRGLDAAAYDTLVTAYPAATSREAQVRLLSETGAAAIASNIDLLGRLAPSDINAMLDMATTGLVELRKSNHSLCKGATYARFEGMAPARVEDELRSMGLDPVALFETSLSAQAEMLEIFERTRRAPQSHGKLTNADEAAIQSMVMKLMNEPALLSLAMTNGSDLSALNAVDLCQIGEVVLREVRALPDATKARALSSALSMPEVADALRQARASGF